MDRADLDGASARAICAELDALIVEMGERGRRISSWYGGLARAADMVEYELANRGLGYEPLAGAAGWSLRNVRMDMRALDAAGLGGRFHHIASVCVFEHIPISGRIEVGGRIHDLLVDGGSFSITFDYLNPSRLARIDSPEDV